MIRLKRGFSLLEVTIAVVILSTALIVISRIISMSYYYAERVENIYKGTELAWVKLHEIEEDIKKNGLPTLGPLGKEDEGEFEEDEYEGFRWKYSIKKVYIPIPDLAPGADDEGGKEEEAAGMLMGVKPMIEDFFKERIRKLTLEVLWGEGRRESEKVQFTLFLTTEGTVKDFKEIQGPIKTGNSKKSQGGTSAPSGFPSAPSPWGRK